MIGQVGFVSCICSALCVPKCGERREERWIECPICCSPCGCRGPQQFNGVGAYFNGNSASAVKSADIDVRKEPAPERFELPNSLTRNL